MMRATPLLSIVFVLTVATSARAGDVTTIAGAGVPGYSGDNAPAIAALLADPQGLAVAPNGTIYFADSGNFRIRAISPAGIISTVAGSGVPGDVGDGGPATSATIGSVAGVALDATGTELYFADGDHHVVRRVDLGTGIISVLAGTGVAGFDGDSGPATLAQLDTPRYVAVDAAGNVYITDTLNHRIRKVDAVTSHISTFAGDGGTTSAGDGGLATAASFGALGPLAVDSSGNVFLVDHGAGSNERVRGIEAGSSLIITIAGGGNTIPGIGTATTMELGTPQALAVDNAGHLLIASHGPQHQVYKVDLASDLLSVFAGTGAAGDTGDGGPALAAAFSDLSGAAFMPTGELLVTSNHTRIRSIDQDAPVIPFDVLISLTTTQAFLDLIQTVAGSVIMINVGGHDFLIIPNMTSVGLNVTLANNSQVLIIDLGALQSVGGNVEITGNLALTSLDLSALTTVGGSLTITGNPALTAVLVSGVTSVGGDLNVIGTAARMIDLSGLHDVGGNVFVNDNTSAIGIDLGALTSVGDDLAVNDNTSATGIDLAALTTAGDDLAVNGNTSAAAIDLGQLASAGGDVAVNGNTSATIVDLGSLTTTVGSVDVNGNTSATGIDLGALTSTGSDISVNGNTSATSVDLGGLTTAGDDLAVDGNTAATDIDLAQLASAGGDVSVSGNTSAPVLSLGSLTTTVGFVQVSGNSSLTSVDLGQLSVVGGDVIVTDNGPSTTVALGSLTVVEGNLIVETSGRGSFDVVAAAVGGDSELTTRGYTTVAGTTSGRHTAVQMGNGETLMSVHVGPATFVPPVDFAITQIPSVSLPPEYGTAPDGSAATIDPVVAYKFNFGAPTLAADATLSFEIQLDGLPAATQAAVLAALPAGTVTLATKQSAAGSQWQAFPLCTGGAVPTAEGCVLLETLDAAGVPTTGTPAILRFSGVVSQFSRWGVALVSPAQPCGTPASAVSMGPGCGADLTGTPPVIGQLATLEVQATTAGATGLLYLSSVGAAPTPFHGCLFDLDLAHLFFVGTFVTDGSAAAELDFSVPPKPAFCGRQVMLQAILIAGQQPLQLEISRGLLLTLGS